MHKKKGSTRVVISPLGLGSIYSYELYTDKIITRLFGIIPIHTIYLQDIYYLRPATLDELARGGIQLHCLNLLPQWRKILPTYVVQTRSKRLVLNLQKGTMFMLNQAIEASKVSRRRALAS